MANPVLNDRSIESARAGWAAPKATDLGFPPPTGATPINDGPISPWSSKVLTIGGTMARTGALFVILLVSAAIGWAYTQPAAIDEFGNVQYRMPALAMVGVFVGIGLVFLLMFKPMLAKYIAPVYAIAEGFFVGSLSKMYDAAYSGIVLQAVGATIAVFGVMLVLYATRVIKVTQRLRAIIMSATIGLMVFYGVSLVLNLFGVNIPFLRESSGLGIAFSVFAAGLAAMNLLVDFDMIERAAKSNVDKDFEWYAAFGLLVTVVWLYLELLRLFAKLQRR